MISAQAEQDSCDGVDREAYGFIWGITAFLANITGKDDKQTNYSCWSVSHRQPYMTDWQLLNSILIKARDIFCYSNNLKFQY